MHDVFERLIDEINTRGYGETTSLFSERELQVLADELHQLIDLHEVRPARVGALSVEREVSAIRQDDIYWLKPESPSPRTTRFFGVMAELSYYLSSTCFVSLNRMEFHFARYQPGAFYQRHRDSFRGGVSRKFSVILYLNRDWVCGDGGELALYLEDGITLIEPSWGKLVMFQSDLLEHEVMTALKTRYSLTGWLRYDDLTLSLDLS